MRGRTFGGLWRRNRRDPLTITIVSRGGSECWWEVRARGCVARVPGHVCVEDLFAMIYDGNGRSPGTSRSK